MRLFVRASITVAALLGTLTWTAVAAADDYDESIAPVTVALPISESPMQPAEVAGSFAPSKWTDGVHLLTGIGANSSYFATDTGHQTLSLGLNFKADVGWYFSDHLALEAGSAVKFNRSDDYLLWDTLFTLGFRYRFHSSIFGTDATFVRVFAGGSPTVIYPSSPKTPFTTKGATRSQINGPVAGLGTGCFFRTQKGLNWFWELDAAYQQLRYRDAIVDQTDVPTVLQSNEVGGNPTIVSLALNLGLVLF
jgi:hypothetical protein